MTEIEVVPMYPLCLATVALVTAGATSFGAFPALAVLTF